MIVDCAVHPLLEDDALAEAMGAPWNLADLPVPSLFGDQYAAPFDPLSVPAAVAADPVRVLRELFERRGYDAAVLTPSTRGYFPNPQQAAALATATNVLIDDLWLSLPEAAGRFFGSIRVAVNDAATAAREIARWASEPRFVQVAVPMRVLAPYGDERYFPIWRAASDHGLPVFVHDDQATLVEPTPTPVGYPRFFAEYHALRPTAAIVHLASLVTCGVFERLPDLRFIFGDLGIDFARSLLWRVDKDWRSDRVEIPWVVDRPSTLAWSHARFVVQPEDKPQVVRDGEDPVAEWMSQVLFGSRYPYWDGVQLENYIEICPPDARGRVLAENALDIYPRLAAYIHAARGGEVIGVPAQEPGSRKNRES